MQYLLSNGSRLRIREVTAADAAALLDMFRQAVEESAFLMTSPAEARQLTLDREREFIAGYVGHAQHLFLVGEVEGALVATLSVTQSKWEKQRHVGEFGIAVLRPYWNLGIARRMMNAMQQWAEAHPQIRCLQLSVMAGNEKAIRIYRNFGFVEEGRRRGALCTGPGRYEDVILMAKWVKDEPL